MAHRLYVFGSNGEGQLGIPAANIVNTPTLVPIPESSISILRLHELEGLTAIRGGDNHTLLYIRTGTVYGAGDNRKGQLDSERKKRRIDQFTLIADASHVAATCESSAYLIDYTLSVEGCYVKTHGSGQWGELSSGSHSSDSQPNRLPGKAVDLAAGVWHYVAIMLDGSVYGWGKARHGQLGNGLSGKVTVPTRIEDVPFRPDKVICGKDFTYFVGNPAAGKHIILGQDKFKIISNMPDHINGWKDIGATWYAIFVLFNDGTLTAWGKENMWKLLPPNLPPLDKIAVGSDHILAVTNDGKLISWGWGKHGNCGDLSNIEHEVKNDMVSGFWNEIALPGEIDFIGAGYCTSFVVTK
jgi:protein ATS1